MKTFFLFLILPLLLIAHPGDAQDAGVPVLSNAGNTALNYQEGDEPVTLTPLLEISDDNSQRMKMATFQFGDDYASTVDELYFEETESIKALFERNTGTLYLLAASALDGVTTQSMQMAMRTVAYQTVDDNPGEKDISVSITVTDLEGNSSTPISRTIRVEPVSDAPVLSSKQTSPRVASPGTEYQVFDDVEVEDPDDETFSRAIIEIEDSNGLLDELSVDDDDTELEIEEERRRIVITGNASKSEYLKIIESIEYEYPSFFSRQTGIRKIRLELTDASGVRSNLLSRYFVIQPIIGQRINIPPSLENLKAETDEGETYNFEIALFRDSFNSGDNDQLTAISIESLPEHGKLFLDDQEFNNQLIINDPIIQLNEIQQLSYVPDPFYNGDDSFLWNATDRENFAANPAVAVIEIKSVNQEPVLNLPSSVDAEEDTATPISNISLTDPDNTELKVELQASEGGLSIPASLVDRNLVDFKGGSQNGDNKLSFEGPAALVAFAVSGLVYTPENSFTGSDAIEIKADDKDGGKVEGTIEINVEDINDAPELQQLEASPITYTENENPIPISDMLTVTDEEADLIASASVSISQGFDARDTLLVETQEGISSTYGEGTLSISGDASAAVYQTVLRSIRFASQGDDPAPGRRTISFVATDTVGATSREVNRSVDVEAVNDAPLLTNIEENQLGFVSGGDPVNITNELVVRDEDDENLEQATISFIGNTFDEAIDLLEFSDTDKITASWNASEGVLKLEGSASPTEYQEAIRSVNYQNLSEVTVSGVRIIAISVNDGEAASNQAERELVPNQPPLISSFEKTTEEEQPVTFAESDFPFQDTDDFPDGELFGIIITQLPEKAVLTLDEDTLTAAFLNMVIPADEIEQLRYRPLPDANGSDSFNWNASDGASFAESDAQVNITISAVPDPPVANDFSVETEEDQPLTFTGSQFIDASTDPDGDALASVIIRSSPANGTLSLNNITLPANSQISLNELDQLAYLPAKNYAGQDAFEWIASDGTNNSLVPATVNITVNPVNDPPVITSFTRAIQEGQSYTFRAEDFAQSYLDVEGTPLVQLRIESLPSSGTLLLNDTPVNAGSELATVEIGNLEYQPAEPRVSTTVSFEWSASDGSAYAENTALVNIIIGVGVTDFSINVSEDEDYSFGRFQFSNNYGNPGAELQQIRIEELPAQGSLFINQEAVQANQEISESVISQLIYRPDNNFSGEDSFSWNADGGAGYADQPATVQITVESVNDAPMISAIPDQQLVAGSTSAAIPFQVSDLETEAEALGITVFSGDQSIIPTEQISVSGGSTERSLTINVPEGVSGQLTLSLVVSDGDQQSEAQFTVEVTPYAIRITVDALLEICEGESASIQLAVEGGQPPYQLQTLCEEGDCSATYSDGVITFAQDVSNTYFISLVDDNGIRSNVDTVSVAVTDCSALQLEIPTAFTPNGDQVNDAWLIENIQYLDAVDVSVYNRYGQRLFNSQGYATPWDGTYENNLLPAGTYYYVIQVAEGAEIYNGSVSILR